MAKYIHTEEKVIGPGQIVTFLQPLPDNCFACKYRDQIGCKDIYIDCIPKNCPLLKEVFKCQF